MGIVSRVGRRTKVETESETGLIEAQEGHSSEEVPENNHDPDALQAKLK
jgi:hypothetical protein